MARSGISSPSAGCQDIVRILTEGRLTVYRGKVYGATHWLGVSQYRMAFNGQAVNGISWGGWRCYALVGSVGIACAHARDIV